MPIDDTANNQDIGSPNGTGDGAGSGPSTIPRHVQWASKPKIEHVEHILHSESEGEGQRHHQRTLDEQGSDPVALARVHRALESHLRMRSLPPDELHPKVISQATDVARAPEPYPQVESSRQGRQPNEQDPEEHVFASADEDVSLLLFSARMQEGVGNGRDVEGIVGEHGLAEEKWWKKRARRLVRMHTMLLRSKAPRTTPWVSSSRFQKFSDAQLEEVPSGHGRDLESNMDTTRHHISPLPRGQGILSALLTLYHPGGSVSSSPPTSRGTTPTDSDRESPPIPDDAEENQRLHAPPTSYFDPHTPTTTGLSPIPETLAPTWSTFPSAQQNTATTVSPMPNTPACRISPPGKHRDSSLPMSSNTPLSLHLPYSVKKIRLSAFPSPGTRGGRPTASQNGGGVIGSLIATSGNLRGAAAPAPSTIGPNVRKRVFGLSRYEIVPDGLQLELKPINRQRTHSAPITPQVPSTPDQINDLAPANDAPGTGTPKSISDTSISQKDRETEKHTRKPLSSLTERIPLSLHWGFGSRPLTPPHDKSLKRDDASRLSGKDGERGRSYRRGEKERRRKAEIFITKHVAEIMQRQEFLVKLARALMMFAAPTHRLQAQIQATARVLDLEVSTFYLPNVMLISFGDAGTSTSNLKFIRQGSSLDLSKLLDAHKLYWKVIHDEIPVPSASASLDFLMHKPPLYHGWQTVILGGLCSSSICSLAFSGSFVDSLVALPLGSLLILVQNFSTRNELYSNVFEITIATLLSFISAALASTSRFCYAAVASSSVVLILPGFIVLTGSLELASREIVSGAVRVCFAVIYSLFLGFGIAMGADVYSRTTGLSVVGPDDYRCGSTHQADGPWWQRTVPIRWAFLSVPLYSLFLSLRNQAPLWDKELPVTIFISCGGWAANYFAGLTFVGRPDVQSALGAFAVGIVANTYARFFSGNAHVVMITGILFQLPSGLANGGLLTFAANDNKGQQFQSYQAGFQVVLQLVAVGIGLTVGLFTSVVIVHPLGGSRGRAAGIFSL